MPESCKACARSRGWRGPCLVFAMMRGVGSVLLKSLQRFSSDETFQLAAALAYYSLLSMAPLLLIAVALAGVFFADGRVHMELIEQMRSLAGNAGAELAQTVIDHTGSEARSAWSLVVGGLLMFIGAATVFA